MRAQLNAHILTSYMFHTVHIGMSYKKLFSPWRLRCSPFHKYPFWAYFDSESKFRQSSLSIAFNIKLVIRKRYGQLFHQLFWEFSIHGPGVD